MNVYGTPTPCIPMNVAAAAASMSRAELIAALAGNYIICGPNKLGVTAAALEEVEEGASDGLALVNPTTDAAARDLTQW